MIPGIERKGTDLNLELSRLRKLTVLALRQKHREVTGRMSKSSNRSFLIRKIAWEMQAQTHGGLSDRARSRAREILSNTSIRLRAWKQEQYSQGISPDCAVWAAVTPTGDYRLPMPGQFLTKEYKGQRIVVTVLKEGFEYNQKVFDSLSAVARHITGTKWNGFLFFGLMKPDPLKSPRRKPKDVEHGK